MTLRLTRWLTWLPSVSLAVACTTTEAGEGRLAADELALLASVHDDATNLADASVRNDVASGERVSDGAGYAHSADENARYDANANSDEPATGPGCGPQSLRVGTHKFAHRSANGMSYSYYVVVPPSYVPTKRTPTVFFWHALTSFPDESRTLLHVDQTANKRGVITVHPESPDQSWDVGSCCTGTVLGRRRNEEVFVRELVAAVKTKVCVDSRRVYTTGFSNGAMISQYLACKAPDLFAAAVGMGGTLTIPKAQCRPTRAVPLLMLNGTSDPLVGYPGPSFSGGLSVVDAFRFWGQMNACQGQPVQTLARGRTLCASYQQCRDGVEVGLCASQGMGHCVNGMKKESAVNCLTRLILPLGPPNDDIDGVDMAYDFLLRWTLP